MRTRKEQDLILIDHDFLAFPAGLDGLRTRWLRQDGFAVTTSDWADPQAAKSFNFRDPRYSDALHDAIAFKFESPATYTLDLKDILAFDQDPVPRRLPEQIDVFFKEEFPQGIDPVLDVKISSAYPGPGPDALPNDAPIPSLLKELSWWGEVAFAARCAKRCRNLFLKSAPQTDPSYIAQLDAAINFADAASRAGSRSPLGIPYPGSLNPAGPPDSLVHSAGWVANVAAGMANVYEVNTASYCSSEACVSQSLKALRAAAVNGLITPAELDATVSRMRNQGQRPLTC